MRLTSFSVERYRSIATARKIPVQDYTLLIGPNNEGKSNILHALALGMQALVNWREGIIRTADGRLVRRPMYSRELYRWERDFPLSLQGKYPNGVSHIILEFELSDGEVREFKEQIGSSLNGSLPIQISFGGRKFEISIQKPGRGQATLNRKVNRIAAFVSSRIKFEHIPAIRTASSAERIIERLVEVRLSELENHPLYLKALSDIEDLQRPILEELAVSIRETVRGFLPAVKDVTLKPETGSRYRALRRNVEILIDDGAMTLLNRKGDGVQSLVALALMRHASARQGLTSNSVIAIEEPESHLHPDAIHELRKVIGDLSRNSQIVITTHSPLFCNREIVSCNIIVHKNRARPANHIREIREILGVRFSDNLQNAYLVILVEGSDDVCALRSILSVRNTILAKALQEGRVQFDDLGGASALAYKGAFYLNSACQVHCFLDDDREGRHAFDKAQAQNLLQVRDVNFCSVPGMKEAELEDLYDKDVYREEFRAEFGVDIKLKVQGKRKKWSEQTGAIFKASGKPWSDRVKQEVKNWLADFAAQHPREVVHPRLGESINAFVENLVGRLPDQGP